MKIFLLEILRSSIKIIFFYIPTLKSFNEHQFPIFPIKSLQKILQKFPNPTKAEKLFEISLPFHPFDMPLIRKKNIYFIQSNNLFIFAKLIKPHRGLSKNRKSNRNYKFLGNIKQKIFFVYFISNEYLNQLSTFGTLYWISLHEITSFIRC